MSPTFWELLDEWAILAGIATCDENDPPSEDETGIESPQSEW